MKKFHSIRLLSIILVFALLIQMMPMQSFAATTEDPMETVADQQPEISVLGEVEALREEDTKHFRLSDGSFVAVAYGTPVHYQDESGGWQDINNSLVTDSSASTYQTANADSAVAFSTSLDNGKLFTTTKGNLSISMSLLDTSQAMLMISTAPEAELSAAEDTPETAAAEIIIPAELITFSRSAAAVIIDEEPVIQELEDTHRGWDIGDVMPDNLQSSLMYEDVFPGVDLMYTTYGYNIKEQIIVKEAQDSYRYDFLLELDGLTAILNEDGSASLLNTEGAEIYVIPVPFMMDGTGSVSYDVQYAITNTAQGTVLTVTADSAWINAEDRVFPVMIDPSFEIGTSSSDFYATYVQEKSPTQTTSNPNVIYIGAQPSSTSNLGRTRAFFHFHGLPSIPSGSDVVDAQLQLRKASFTQSSLSQIAIGVYELTSDKPSASTYQSWLASMTWNQNASIYDTDNVIDYAYVKAASTDVVWDVTELVKKWYEENTANKTIGLAMINDTSTSTSSYAYASFYAHNAANPPVLTVSYRNDVGIEPYYTYATLGGGSAGTAYIADAKGQLKVAKQLAAYASSVNPFSLNLIYNSDYFSLDSSADYQAPNKMGLEVSVGQGWTLDYIQKVVPETINGTQYIKYFDGDGTIHYFRKDDSSSIYYDEDGLGLKIQSTGTGNYTMSDNNGNTWTFTSYNLTATKDATGNQMLIYYKDGKLTQVSQKNYNCGELIVASFTYDGIYLDTVKDWAGNKFKLVYTGNKLTSVQKNDVTIAQYSYENNRITKMTDTESSYSLAFTYADGKLSSYKEVGGSTTGAIVDITYPNRRQITYQDYGADRKKGTSDDIYSHYLHDYKGRTVNAYTTDHQEVIIGASNSAYFTYDSTKTDAQMAVDRRNNRTLRASTILATKRNLSYNVGFENSAAYTLSGLSITSTNARTGTKSLMGSLGVTTLQYAWRPTDSIPAGSTFTFSAYVDTRDVDYYDAKGVYLKVVDPNGNTWVGEPLGYKTPGGLDGGWARISVTFTSLVSGSHKLYVCSEGSTNASGNFYVDDLQFEMGDAPSTSNLVENGGFEMGSSSWVYGDNISLVTLSEDASRGTVLQIVGDPGNNNTNLYQDIPINLKGTQTYVLSGWVKANAVPDNLETDPDPAKDVNKQCGLRGILFYSDGTTEFHYIPFNPDLSSWQFASIGIVPKCPEKTVTKFRIYLAYERNANIAYFDDISLLRESVQSMAYDTSGRQTSLTSPNQNTENYTYHDATDMIESFNGGYGTYSYTYDKYNRPITASNAYLTQTTTYDQVGNVSSTTLAGTSGKKIATSANYGGNYNRITDATDSTGAVTKYNYENHDVQMMAIPNRITDANGTVTDLSHDSHYRTTQVTIANTATLDYTYSSGNLSKVTRTDSGGNTQAYNFTYDSFGNMLTLSVGSKKLATYTYGTGNGLLATQTYGNGAKVSFAYNNNLNQLEKATYPDGRTMTYTYTPDGQVYSAKETGTNRTVDYVYSFDAKHRLISSEKKVNGTTVLRTRQLFNSNDQLTHENWKMDTKTYYRILTYNTGTDYSLNTVSMPTDELLTMGYDSLRRLTSVTGGLYNLSYTYRDRDATYTTTQVSKLSYTGLPSTLNISYTYDTLGNIATYTAPGKSAVTYTYDNQGQLLKAAGSKTYTYTYDTVGNILTASDGTNNHTYTYGDTNWRDLLTKFDDQSITYDASGNPTSYYNGTRWTFGWSNGRSLTSASGGGNTISYTYDLQDGARSSKTVNGTKHTYIYGGGKLLRETYGDTTLDFLYDVNGKPYAMVVNETTTYHYITNLQGDVIYMVDSSGATVATYDYDPYGKVITATGTIASTNPLRYRGYYYDAETKLYLCGSRYYDPATGRFINADTYASTGQGIIGNNMFTYCGNNPITRKDSDGKAFETVLDILSLGASIADVIQNPNNPWAWVGLAGDLIDVAVPFVAGVGETAKAISFVANAADTADDIYDTTKAISVMAEATDAADDLYDAAKAGDILEAACFVAGTLVCSSDGNKPIEDIQTGDYVWAWDEETGDVALKKVVETYINQSDELIHIFVNGEEIITTPTHPFYSPVKGWTDAVHLRAGDILVLVNGEYVVVEEVQHEVLETQVTVYNFQVEDFHTYFISNSSILVHNKCFADTDNLPSFSTGRTEPQNLVEQLAMESTKSNPTAGKIIKSQLNDTRIPSGYSKFQQVFHTSKGQVNIHYVGNTKDGVFFDFKFKD